MVRPEDQHLILRFLHWHLPAHDAEPHEQCHYTVNPLAMCADDTRLHGTQAAGFVTSHLHIRHVPAQDGMARVRHTSRFQQPFERVARRRHEIEILRNFQQRE